MKPILITSGEPAGIGPDLCLKIANHCSNVVIAGDRRVFRERANVLNLNIDFEDYDPDKHFTFQGVKLWHMPMTVPVQAGILHEKNAENVLQMLRKGCEACLAGEFSALVTAPVHKAHLQKADPAFLGHTEFFQMLCKTSNVAMMLADTKFRVALVTTHLPLRAVPNAITMERIEAVIETIYWGLRRDFGIAEPRIAVAGLNPHAGENGCLGMEEIEVIFPAVQKLCERGWNIEGPMSADTMFVRPGFDAYVAMYHDQGLSVLKYATFGQAANITLGLPIVRTSVDHGTALELAGTGLASESSLKVAIEIAEQMVKSRGWV